jgi:hypothetical protein
MTRFATSYAIARPTGRCAATGDLLTPGTMCVATLCERAEDDGFDRLDYSLAAWESGARPQRLLGSWKSIVPEPDARRRLLVDDDVLMNLFERLADDTRPQRVAFRFVLALILMRKRLLKYVGRNGVGEEEHWLLTPRDAAPDSPPLPVRNPRLSDDDVRALTDQLSEILQSEL